MTFLAKPRPIGTQLLVSVRNAAEAHVALSAGVALLDVKEPLAGALGAAGGDVLQSVLDIAHAFLLGKESPDSACSLQRMPTISAALGELLAYEPRTLPSGLRLAKFGLAGCSTMDGWPHRWRQAIAGFSPGIDPVAVVYADYQRAAAPRPVDVIAVGREVGCRYVLVDTFDKAHGNLLDLWKWREIERLVETVQSQGMHIVLAGSLNVSGIRRLLPLRPDVIAVRGAACGGDRNGTIDAERVHELVSLVTGARVVAKKQLAGAAEL